VGLGIFCRSAGRTVDLTGIVPAGVGRRPDAACLSIVSVRQRLSGAKELVDLTGIEPVTS